MQKQILIGKSLSQLKELVAELKMPSFTAKQIVEWLYEKRATDFEMMTNISKSNRQKLSETCEIGLYAPMHQVVSADGTEKYLFKLHDGYTIETVYIPDGDRATLCVSSQVGCRMNCHFCMTGKQGFAGHLTVTDILNQIYSLPERDTLTNVVFMGQGEPFDNLDNVLRATELLTADYGYAWSPKRITVSTVGLRKGLKRFLDESECHLAISLHNPFHEQRARLMPAENSYPLQEMLDLLRQYDFTHQRRLSFEYIMFEGVNDTMAHAKKLLRLLNGLECRMNLIRFHTIPDVELKGTTDAGILKFRDYLTGHGLFSTIRASRGQDIYAACGLLSTAKQQGQNI